jgi:hypothetical protein
MAGRLHPLLLVLVIGALPHALSWAGEPDGEADDFDELLRAEQELEARTAAVNTGTLRFLAEPPDETVHHHHNTVLLRPESLQDGWATLIQCHDHLDAVPRVQVVFNEDRTRELTIELAEHIGEAWVEEASVQMVDVGRGARLCVRAESQVLEAAGEGIYVMRNGPFMRQFLDGYFPMRVSMEVHLPRGRLLRFVSVDPVPQEGFSVQPTRHAVYLDTWFEGRLHTELRFEATTP